MEVIVLRGCLFVGNKSATILYSIRANAHLKVKCYIYVAETHVNP